MLGTFTYVRASSLDDALKQLERTGSYPHSGGTDLLGCLRDGVMKAETVVSLGRIDGLRGIAPGADGGLRIGALTTIAELAGHADIKARCAALSQAASVVASPQLRNQGTIGGNLCQRPRCWYFRGDYDCARKGGDVCYAADGENRYHCIFGGGRCQIVHPSDTAPALVALDASVRVAGPKGARVVPLEKFFVLPADDVLRETVLARGEIVTEVLLPPADPAVRSSYRKVRARGSWDFAMAGLALAIAMKGDRIERARAVLSGVAPIPWRSAGLERALAGQRLEARTISRAADAAVAGAEPLAQNAYKVPLVRGLVEEVLSSYRP